MRASKVTYSAGPNDYLITLSEAEAKAMLDLLDMVEYDRGGDVVQGLPNDPSKEMQSALKRLLNKEMIVT